MSENSSILTSNDLQPTTSDMSGTICHISQIPGLSPTISFPEGRVRGRRTGVLESDSDYIKLAKQGGHKGLLCHDETVTLKASAYKPPDWFCSTRDSSKPSLINNEEKENPGAFQPPTPPFGTDNMSAWERNSGSNDGETEMNVLCSPMEKLQAPHQQLQTSKFKRIVFDKKPVPVSMSKLLSFGYAEEEKEKANTRFPN